MGPAVPAAILAPAYLHLDPSAGQAGAVTCLPALSSRPEPSAGLHGGPATLQSIVQESHPNVPKTATMRMAWSATEQGVVVTEAVADLEQNDVIFSGGQQPCLLLQSATLQTVVAAKLFIAAPSRRLSYTLD